MPKTLELVQTLVRVFGAFWLLSGTVQFVLAAALIAVAIRSPLGVLGTCAVQMGVFAIGSIIIGALLIRFSGPMARFATKLSANPTPPSAA